MIDLTERLALFALLAATTSLACDPDTPEPAQDAGSTPVDLGRDVGEDAGADAGDAPRACTPKGGVDAGELVTSMINGWSVSASRATGAWSIELPSGQLDSPADCLRSDDGELFSVRTSTSQMSVRFGVGSFRTTMSRMEWRGPEGDVSVESGGDALALTWPVEGGDVTLTFSGQGDSDLRVELSTSVEGATAGEITLPCSPDEGFFGLGSQTFGMNLRGGRFPLLVQEQGIGKPESGNPFPFSNIPEAAYAPMGIWHSSRGYAAILTHDAYSEIDTCEAHSDRVALRSFDAMPGFVLVAGDTPLDRMESITEYTGRITDPAPWTFAPWNDAVGGPERLAEVARILREEGVPSSAIWSEDWIGGESTATGFRLSYAWEWDPETYPDLPGDIERLHADGFAFLAYFNPFVPDTTRMWEEGVANGYLVTKEDGSPYTQSDPALRQAGLVDLFDPDAREWYKSYMRTAATTLAIDGWMTDFAEWLPIDAKTVGQGSPWALHNLYSLEQQRAHREVMLEAHPGGDAEAANNWTFFARSGWASINGGSAGASPTMWGGDQTTDWGYDDGFPTAVAIGANLGLSGVAIYGSDVAGYSSLGDRSPTNKELFLRWSSLGAFHPLMRTHHGDTECVHWAFDRDPETLAHYRRWASIHTLLYPYLRARADEAVASGWPITRHPYLVFPEVSELWTGPHYAFFLGSDLLVAPVLEEGATSRPVHLPEAGWWPLLGDEPIASAGDHDAQVPHTEIAVFVRPGSVLPLLGEVVDSFYGATSDEVSDLSDVEGSYRLALYPAQDGGLTETKVGDAVVTGQGWSGALDWSSATLGGRPLPSCDVAPDGESCVDGQARTARLVGSTLSLAVGSASLEIAGGLEQSYLVGVGADAFGELSEPTELLDLDAEVEPPCLEE